MFNVIFTSVVSDRIYDEPTDEFNVAGSPTQWSLRNLLEG